MTWVVAHAAHQIPDRPPLRIEVGDEVTVDQRDTEWPEFVFVTAAHGTGWVPHRHLAMTGPTAIVHTAYDTTELPTTAGDALLVVEEDEISGWLWCRSADGREGWVPRRTVRMPGEDRPG
jgi:hypothetical protein